MPLSGRRYRMPATAEHRLVASACQPIPATSLRHLGGAGAPLGQTDAAPSTSSSRPAPHRLTCIPAARNVRSPIAASSESPPIGVGAGMSFGLVTLRTATVAGEPHYTGMPPGTGVGRATRHALPQGCRRAGSRLGSGDLVPANQGRLTMWEKAAYPMGQSRRAPGRAVQPRRYGVDEPWISGRSPAVS